MRRGLAFLLVLLLVGTVDGARANPAISDGTGPLDTAADLAAATRFEALIPEHTFYGMVVPLGFDKWPHLDPTAKPIRMEGEADSGNYTGVYLAAQSWRYAQSKVELKKLGVDPLDNSTGGSDAAKFWRAQRNEALARSRQIVDYYHLLVNISREWKTTFNPKIDSTKDPTEYGWLDYGGGIIPAEPGLLMRTCTPEDASPPHSDLRQNFAPTGELLGPFPWEDGRNWYCINFTSRDSYAGTAFGLSVALDFLATRENADLRRTLAKDLMAMTDYAIKYLWFQARPHGKVANPVLDNDLRGPISPLFIQTPIQRLHLLQTARHAAKLIGDTQAKLRYEVLWQAEVAATILPGQVLVTSLVDSTNPHNDYYKFQLNLMSFFNLIRLEPAPRVRERLRAALSPMDATLADDGNAFFEAMTYGLTGEKKRLRQAVRHHHEWLDYYAFHEETARRGVTPFLHTGRCDISGPVPPDAPLEQQPLECVPKDQVDMVIRLPGLGEQEVPSRPGSVADKRAKDPLPVGVRRLADFLWQKDPTIVGGDHNTPWRGPSIDFLASYWMLRYYSEVRGGRPANPLPAWRGPRFT